MDEELDYLWETLGLEITADLWPERDKIHPTLLSNHGHCRIIHYLYQYAF